MCDKTKETKEFFPKRKPIRLKDYDYSTPGAYFITICTDGRRELLSKITVGQGLAPAENILSAYGIIADKQINDLQNRFKTITIDKYVIMPNHIHLIISIGTMKASSPTRNIEQIIRSFKTMVTKEAGKSLWQRSYHDRIIRNEKEYQKIWQYIDTNVIKWETDCFYGS